MQLFELFRSVQIQNKSFQKNVHEVNVEIATQEVIQKSHLIA